MRISASIYLEKDSRSEVVNKGESSVDALNVR